MQVDSLTPKPSGADTYVLRLERALRLSNMTSALAITGMVVALSGYAFILPLKEYITNYVSFQPQSSQMVTLQTGHVAASDLQLIVERYFEAYVCDRETIDNATEAARMDRVRLMTPAAEWDAFSRYLDPSTNKQSPLVKFKESRLSRKCVINAVTPIGNMVGAYQVDWTAEDYRERELVATSTWLVTFTFYQANLRLSQVEKMMNPLGLQIANYTQRPRAPSSARK